MPTIRSSLTAMPSEPASHSSAIEHAHVARRHPRVDAEAAVLEPERHARTRKGDEPGGEPRVLELGVQLAKLIRAAGALGLERRDPLAEREDLGLEGLLLGLQPEGRIDERRPLLGRVANPRTLGGDLGGDEEAQHEQRDGEGHLDAREAADPREDPAHGSSSSRVGVS